MALIISKTAVAPYDGYSEGDGSDPISAAVDLDNSGAPALVASGVVAASLVATEFNYTDIQVTPVTEDVGIDWQVSLDNAAWADTVAVPAMDALAADVVTPLWFRAQVDNDGRFGVSIQTGCKISVTRKGSPV